LRLRAKPAILRRMQFDTPVLNLLSGSLLLGLLLRLAR